MAIDLQEYSRLKKASDDAKTAAERAAGALEGQMKLIKSEFGLDSIEAAEQELKILTDAENEQEQRYNEALSELKRRLEGKLP